MTTQIMTRKEKLDGLKQTVQSMDFQNGLKGILPKVMTPQRFGLTALAIVGRDPKLLECTQVSLLRCMVQSASVGLEIGNELGHAYLVPFRDRKSDPPSTVCTLILGYRGIVQLLYRSAQISGVEAQVVRQGDEFRYSFGLKPVLEHSPGGSIGNAVTHAYAMLRMKDGTTLFDVMTHEEVEAIRSRSRAGTSGPWVTDYPEMAKKTVLRRLAKLAPMSVEDQRVVTADEHADANLDQSGVFTPEALSVNVDEETVVVEAELTDEEIDAKREYDEERLRMQAEQDAEARDVHADKAESEFAKEMVEEAEQQVLGDVEEEKNGDV